MRPRGYIVAALEREGGGRYIELCVGDRAGVLNCEGEMRRDCACMYIL